MSEEGVHSVKIDSAIRFAHPRIAQALVIGTGANSIKWHYKLNTSVTPTIGGEVTQILSAYVGPMIIEGLVRSPTELKQLREWFLEYLEFAGTQLYQDQAVGQGYRDERAVDFSYAARNWSFKIMPTNFQGFRYDKELYAIPWTLTAEIVSDSALNYLSGVTMTAFTGPLANPAFVTVGYSDPTGTGARSMFVNPLLSADLPQLGQTMGDNFQRLVASFSAGDFKDFAFRSLEDYRIQGLPTDIAAEYTKAFGSEFLYPGSQTDSGGGTGSGSSTGAIVQNPHTQNEVVTDIAIIFEKAGIPPRLGVAVAYQESGFNPDAKQGGKGIGLFQMNDDGTGRGSAAKIKAGMAAIAHGGQFTDGYPAVDQIKDAAGWFNQYKPFNSFDATSVEQMAHWAQAAQAAGNAYWISGQAQPVFLTAWKEAAVYLAASDFGSSGVGTIVGLARAQLGVKETSTNAGPEVNKYLASVGLSPGNAWCAAFVYWVFQQVLGDQNPLEKTGLVLNQFNYGKSKGWQRPLPTAQPGDLGIFNWTGVITTDPSQYHIGIVTRIVNGVPHLISGNFGDAVSTEGPLDLVAIIRAPVPADKIGS